eukprot:5789120-Prymnesium_polylepis.1
MRSRFAIAPYGHGRDSYRAWEILACGSIPIMLRDRSFILDQSKFAGLPILWVDQWDEVTPALLRARWRSMNAQAA